MTFWRVLGLAILLALLSAPSQAHEARPLFIEVTEQAESMVAVQWRIPPVVPEQNMPEIALLSCDAASSARRFNGPGGVVGQRFYRCRQGMETASIEIRYPRHNPAVSTLVRLSWLSGESQSILASPEESTIALPGRETRGRVIRDYTTLGLKHILAGYDHLLFVACLVLIAGSLRRVLFAITGFTIAHSITLALAALNIVRVPSPAVEAAIALSIIFLAVEIARGRRETLAWRYPITVAGAFGLLHGFGFATVLSEIGLPQTEVPAALLFFNIGVEIGQVLFVTAMIAIFAALRWARVLARSEEGIAIIPTRLRLPIVYGAGSLASFWMIGRIAAF